MFIFQFRTKRRFEDFYEFKEFLLSQYTDQAMYDFNIVWFHSNIEVIYINLALQNELFCFPYKVV